MGEWISVEEKWPQHLSHWMPLPGPPEVMQ